MEKLLELLRKNGNCLSGNYETLTSWLSHAPDDKNVIEFSANGQKAEATISGEKIEILTCKPIVYKVDLGEEMTLFLSPDNRKRGEFTAGANDLSSLYK